MHTFPVASYPETTFLDSLHLYHALMHLAGCRTEMHTISTYIGAPDRLLAFMSGRAKGIHGRNDYHGRCRHT